EHASIPGSRRPARRRRWSRLAVLHLGNDRPTEGRGADPSPPALYEPVLLRRYRPPRRARHASARSTGIARRRALCDAFSAAGRTSDRRAAFRGAGDPRRDRATPARLVLRGTDDADAARA